MRTDSINISNNNRRFKPSFGRALTEQEMVEYKKTLTEAKNKIGNNGKSVLIVHDACLPQGAELNTGVGNLSSKKSLQFFDFMKNYLGIKSVEILPAGEVVPFQHGQFFCSYHASAFSLSPHQINLELLTHPEYSSILTKDDIQSVINANKTGNSKYANSDKFVNYENVVNEDSPFDKILKKAYLKFKSNGESTLQKEFDTYKSTNEDWLKPKTIFKVLQKKHNTERWWTWPSKEDKELLVDIDDIKQKRINDILSSNKENSEFYYFKQFLADKHLAHSRNSLNERGLNLIGDCLIAFSDDETWANQKAFNREYSVGWGLPALDYETVTKEGSPAEKLLKRKVQLFAQRYDSLRFDVSWAYVQPKLTPFDWQNGKPYPHKKDFDTQILDRIENYVREVKGEDFDVSELIHEFDASPEDFRMLDNTPNGARWREPMMKRTKALGTTYMSHTWGNNQYYLNLNNGEHNFILGAGNHDPQPLRQIAYSMPDINGEVHKPAQVAYLADLFRVDKNLLENPVEFMKAKFAEIMTAKNNQYFYIDVFGEERRFDSQIKNTPDNYRLKISENFEKEYIKELEKGHAFNPMDALEKVFKLKGLNETEQTLYAKIVNFRNILAEKTNDAIKETTQTSKKSPIKAITITGLLAIAGFQLHKYLKNKNVQK